MVKKTKIVCTVGPASLRVETLERMIRAGMNCARINTAYGDFDRYRLIVDNVREVADIPVMVDLKGPEIRLRTDKEMVVNEGDVLEAGFNGEKISFNHNFIDQMNVGDVLFIDNGKIRTEVVEKADGTLRLLIKNGGVIANGKGVNVPNKQLPIQTLSARDRKIIEFAKEYEVEILALSFTRSAKDIHNLRSAAEGFKGAVVAKIENFEGIRNFQSTLRGTKKGLYVSTGGFTKEAKYEAERSNEQLTLIDADGLVELIIQNYDNFDVETRLLIPLVKIFWPT